MSTYEHQQLVDGRRALLISDVRLVCSWLEALCAEHPDLRAMLGMTGSASVMSSLRHRTCEESPLSVTLTSSHNPFALHKPRYGFAVLVLAASTAERLAATGATRQVRAGRLVELVNLRDIDQPTRAKRQPRYADRVVRQEISGLVPEQTEYLFTTSGSNGGFIKISSITCVTADGSHTYVHTTDGRRARSTRSLGGWERILSQSTFVRVHRSTILNLECVERVERLPGCSPSVFVRGTNSPIVMSRRYAARLNKRRV
jgi:two-component system, LytTR family, response regulator